MVFQTFVGMSVNFNFVAMTRCFQGVKRPLCGFLFPNNRRYPLCEWHHFSNAHERSVEFPRRGTFVLHAFRRTINLSYCICRSWLTITVRFLELLFSWTWGGIRSPEAWSIIDSKTLDAWRISTSRKIRIHPKLGTFSKWVFHPLLDRTLPGKQIFSRLK